MVIVTSMNSYEYGYKLRVWWWYLRARLVIGNEYGDGDSMKGDLREQFKEKGVSTIEQFVSQIFLPYTLKQGSDWKTEYDDKKSRMD